MKKLLFLASCILLVFCAHSSVFASDPMLNVEFSYNSSDALKKGDVVEYSLKCSDIASPGLSSFDLVFDYSEGLSYNNDAATSALPSGWVMWDPVDENGEIRIGIIDESVVSAGLDPIEVTLSFTVVSDDFTEESVVLTKRDFYDFDLKDCNYSFADKTETLLVNMPSVLLKNIGASLRLTGSRALRFGAELDGEKGNAVLGMLVCESDKLSGELSFVEEHAKTYSFSKPLFDNTFATTAIEISDVDKEYTFRPFITLTTKNTGRAVNILFEELKRSAADVARLALEGETDAKKISLLNSVISST